jgi:hypothetical protein
MTKYPIINNMKKIAIVYGGPDDEYNFYGNKVKEILEKIDKTIYEPVQIFMTQDSSFKVFNPKHTNKKLFFSENKIFKFLKDQNIKLALPLFIGTYGENKTFENKLKENDIQIVDEDEVLNKQDTSASILN